ncbi:hypothetical protein ACEZDB_12460 [Streptacidiphilus sp. N1-3]|uniref:Uncharacterized protein n=1 Tax=Streptacidiphilus alkalitolerans TaxID=3342712 RepID=A0ABV6WZQ8_9ACTN
MQDLRMVATAAGQLTGETLRHAELRIGAMASWGCLIPAAAEKQALLESVLLQALGAPDRRRHPFGVAEARPLPDGLELRLESQQCVQALLDLLPYRERRGQRRGVTGLMAYGNGNAICVTMPHQAQVSAVSPRRAAPLVTVYGPRANSAAAQLDEHRDRLQAAGLRPAWGSEEIPGTKASRREPLPRNTFAQHAASYNMGSALLRRTRFWQALAGHSGLSLSIALGAWSAFGLSTVSEHDESDLT